ncbi:hypothetical protein BCR44DRAFT_179171 [Catenaria anguillulae PL171]|uniref:Protein kinase domain-containing protein n=1 Tax=Catenaria anguillulae PL171 TaxID=765915 RepID=A0A1Y2H828_9FUNG|nr:hypothetical protein BCR44DRAFT_179171 [Catenaria anguillulae PL171]
MVIRGHGIEALTQMTPFGDGVDDDGATVTMITKLDFDPWREPLLNNVSEQAKEFLAALLKRNPAERMTIGEAIQHPWIAGTQSEEMAAQDHQDDLHEGQNDERDTVSSLSAAVGAVSRFLRFDRDSALAIAVEDLLRSIAANTLTATQIHQVFSDVLESFGKKGPGNAKLAAQAQKIFDDPAHRQLKPGGNGLGTHKSAAGSQVAVSESGRDGGVLTKGASMDKPGKRKRDVVGSEKQDMGMDPGVGNTGEAQPTFKKPRGVRRKPADKKGEVDFEMRVHK